MIWTSIEDTASQLVKLIHPSINRVIAFQNGPELKTPYCVINVKSHDAVTRQEVSTFVETVDTVDVLIVKEVYEVVVTFGFIASENGVQTRLVRKPTCLNTALRRVTRLKLNLSLTSST